MASTFSPTLRLELIGDGDQSGIWGQTTNNNLGALVEQAITGVITIAMVDANYTLANFNGVVDEARNQVLVLTGALSQQRNLIAPLVEKTYIIRNTTTGGFGVQIIGPSGTGVIIPNGVTASVFCDGTNFLPASTGSTGNQSINGNLLVTGTTTLTGALTASTAVFSGAISSVNPSFTGTPTAPTAPSGTSTTQIATTAFVQGVASTLGTMSTQNANAVNITGGTISGLTSLASGTGSFSGNLASLGIVSGSSAVFGAVSGTTGTFSGAVSGTTGTFSGAMSAASLAGSAAAGSGATGTWAISISGGLASGATIASNVTATTQAVSTDNTTVATTAFVRDIIPAGVILMWSGSIASIPAGWLLCNGANGTPNLQDRFIVGAGSAYVPGAAGGSADAIVVSHSHSASSSGSQSAHRHFTVFNVSTSNEGSLSASNTIARRGNYGGDYSYDFSSSTSEANIGLTSNATPSVSVSTTIDAAGSSGTNANLPPYYALAYIMKT
jgi:hypothetical protein